MHGETAYALAALICYGLADVIYKRAAGAGLRSEQFLMGQAWFYCPTLLVWAWWSGHLVPSWAALWGAAAGVAVVIGFYNYARSLRTGSISVIAPVFRLNFLVTAGLAIGLLHEPLTVWKLGGFALALLAGWLLLGGSARQGHVERTAARRALLQALLATLAAGTANFCYKLGLHGGAAPETILAAQALVFSSLITALSVTMNGRLLPPRGFAKHSAPAALALLGAFLFLLHALKHGAASVVVPMAQMGFVVAALVGVVAFKEAWTGRKAAGLCAAAAALALLAMG